MLHFSKFVFVKENNKEEQSENKIFVVESRVKGSIGTIGPICLSERESSSQQY